jgi:probable rRNA maturation factor
MMMKEKYVVRFFYECESFPFSDRNLLKEFIVKLFKNEKYKLGSLHYIFCTDDALRKMNKKFLNHPDYTDILTFPLSEKGMPVEGEIYISIDRIKDNSLIFNTLFKEELLRVIFHGALHLCNYNDHSSQEIKKMRERENHYLRLYNNGKKNKS